MPFVRIAQKVSQIRNMLTLCDSKPQAQPFQIPAHALKSTSLWSRTEAVLIII